MNEVGCTENGRNVDGAIEISFKAVGKLLSLEIQVGDGS
jgi:hypothetical protein